jgi:hypothetical protein
VGLRPASSERYLSKYHKMRRRRFFKTLAVTPAASALLGQEAKQDTSPRPTSPAPPPQNPAKPPAPYSRTPPMGIEYPKLDMAVPDDVADMQPQFFTAVQLAALRKVSEILMPRIGDAPGALEAGAPEFLDFLIGRSPRERQELYRAGLDQLNARSRKQFGKAFSETNEPEASTLLAPLREAWTFEQPTDPLSRFLRAAKQDVRTATMNSREYAAFATSQGSRRGGGGGLYWYPLD